MRAVMFIAGSLLLASSAAAEISGPNYSTGANHFGSDRIIKSSNLLSLGSVRASGDGEVVVQLAKGMNAGHQIGSAPVHEGANLSVRVPVGPAPVTDVVAVLYVDGEAVASRYFDIGDDRNSH